MRYQLFYRTEQNRTERLFCKITYLRNVTLGCHNSIFPLYFSSLIDYTLVHDMSHVVAIANWQDMHCQPYRLTCSTYCVLADRTL